LLPLIILGLINSSTDRWINKLHTLNSIETKSDRDDEDMSVSKFIHCELTIYNMWRRILVICNGDDDLWKVTFISGWKERKGKKSGGDLIDLIHSINYIFGFSSINEDTSHFVYLVWRLVGEIFVTLVGDRPEMLLSQHVFGKRIQWCIYHWCMIFLFNFKCKICLKINLLSFLLYWSFF